MIDPPHAVVVRIGDEETAIRRERDSDRREELGGPRVPGVARITAPAIAGIRVDRSVLPNLAYDVVETVSDVDVPGGIERDAPRLVELRADRRSPVPRVTRGASRRSSDEPQHPGIDRCDELGSVRGHVRLAQVDHIRPIDPALRTEVHRRRIGAGVWVKSAAARNRLDLPGAVDPPNAGVSVEHARCAQRLRAVGDVEISSLVECETDRPIQLRGRGRATISGEARGPQTCKRDHRRARRGHEPGDAQKRDKADC